MNNQYTAKDLFDFFCHQLGPNNLNVLGQYELLQGANIIGVTPSIRIRYGAKEQTPQRIKKESGIELIIEAQTEYEMLYMGQGQQEKHTWTLILDQHDPYKSLSGTVSYICSFGFLHIPRSPIIRPAQELPNNQGIAPARAVIEIQYTNYVSKQY